MSDQPKLTLEILSGPLDGATVVITEETAWRGAGKGPLAFPWDEELGQPQASFLPGETGWQLQVRESPHGTYRLNSGERLRAGTIQLAEGDILKASSTWLLVRSFGHVLAAEAEPEEMAT